MNISDSFWGVGLSALVAKLALVINKIGNDDVENLDVQGLYDYELTVPCLPCIETNYVICLQLY